MKIPMRWLILSHLIGIYTVCKAPYFNCLRFKRESFQSNDVGNTVISFSRRDISNFLISDQADFAIDKSKIQSTLGIWNTAISDNFLCRGV